MGGRAKNGRITARGLSRGRQAKDVWSAIRGRATADGQPGFYVVPDDHERVLFSKACSHGHLVQALEAARILIERGVGAALESGAAEDVRGLVLEGGREVFLHDPITAFAQGMLARALTEAVEPLLPEEVLAYRPGRSTLLGPYLVRALSRRGWHWALGGDLRKYFDTVDVDHVRGALDTIRAPISDEVIGLATFFMTPNIVRDDQHPHVRKGRASTWEPGRLRLLQGSKIAPVLSNIVGAVFVDKPFKLADTDGNILLRYSDDFLILARTKEAADRGLENLQAITERAGFQLHPDKTTRQALDTREQQMRFLGKDVGATVISTPWNRREEQVRCLPDLDAADPETRGVAAQMLDELLLDPRHHHLDLVDMAFLESQELGDIFESIRLDRLDKRFRVRCFRRWNRILDRLVRNLDKHALIHLASQDHSHTSVIHRGRWSSHMDHTVPAPLSAGQHHAGDCRAAVSPVAACTATRG